MQKKNIESVLEEIRHLTNEDMLNKNIFEMLAKLTEEVGELSQELQIEESVYGNSHKKIDEGSIGESIDVIIMGLVMYYARRQAKETGTDKMTNDLVDLISKKLNKWRKK